MESNETGEKTKSPSLNWFRTLRITWPTLNLSWFSTLRDKRPTLDAQTENYIAVICGCIVIFFVLPFDIAEHSDNNTTVDFASTYEVLITLMSICCLCMFFAICYRNNPEIFDYSDMKQMNEENNTKFLMANAFVFAIGNLFMDILTACTFFHCIKIGRHVHRKQFIVLFYHLLRVVFVILQVIFLQVFLGVKVREHVKRFEIFGMKILSALIMGSNLTIWFAMFLLESKIISSQYKQGEYNVTCIQNPDDKVYKAAEEVNEYFQVFILEFSLLQTFLFYLVFPATEKQNHKSPEKSTESDSLNGPGYTDYGSFSNNDEDRSKTYRCNNGLLFGILISLILILSQWNLKEKVHHKANVIFYFTFDIIVHFIIIICCIWMRAELSRHEPPENGHQLHIDDTLLLLSTIFGYFPYLALVSYAAAQGEDAPYDLAYQRSWLIGYVIIIFVSVFLHNWLLIIGHSYTRKIFKAKDDSDGKLCSASCIRQLLFTILACNLGIWVNLTFFESKSHKEGEISTDIVSELLKWYWKGTTWTLLKHLFFPFMIFYRFHSLAMIAHIFDKFRDGKVIAKHKGN